MRSSYGVVACLAAAAVSQAAAIRNEDSKVEVEQANMVKREGDSELEQEVTYQPIMKRDDDSVEVVNQPIMKRDDDSVEVVNQPIMKRDDDSVEVVYQPIMKRDDDSVEVVYQPIMKRDSETEDLGDMFYGTASIMKRAEDDVVLTVAKRDGKEYGIFVRAREDGSEEIVVSTLLSRDDDDDAHLAVEVFKRATDDENLVYDFGADGEEAKPIFEFTISKRGDVTIVSDPNLVSSRGIFSKRGDIETIADISVLADNGIFSKRGKNDLVDVNLYADHGIISKRGKNDLVDVNLYADHGIISKRGKNDLVDVNIYTDHGIISKRGKNDLVDVNIYTDHGIISKREAKNIVDLHKIIPTKREAKNIVDIHKLIPTKREAKHVVDLQRVPNLIPKRDVVDFRKLTPKEGSEKRDAKRVVDLTKIFPVKRADDDEVPVYYASITKRDTKLALSIEDVLASLVRKTQNVLLNIGTETASTKESDADLIGDGETSAINTLLDTMPKLSIFASYLRDFDVAELHDSKMKRSKHCKGKKKHMKSMKALTFVFAPLDLAFDKYSTKPWEYPTPVESEEDAKHNVNDFIKAHITNTHKHGSFKNYMDRDILIHDSKVYVDGVEQAKVIELKAPGGLEDYMIVVIDDILVKP